MLSGMSCHFGFNEFALKAIQRAFTGLSEKDKLGSLVWDEIAIKETLEFNPQTFQFDGFVDLNEESGCNIVPVKHTDLESDLQGGEQIVLSDARRILREENSANAKENEVGTSFASSPKANIIQQV